LGPAELEGIDRHDARKLRHRQVPRTKQPVLQTGPDRYRSPCFAKEAHDVSLDPVSRVMQLDERREGEARPLWNLGRVRTSLEGRWYRNWPSRSNVPAGLPG